jgi:hypothetical protein
MARATVVQELHFQTRNETGLLGRIISALALEGVYIVHLCAYSAAENGYLQMVTRDNNKAKKALGYFIPNIQERDVLLVEFENKAGTLAPVAKILGNHSIFIDYVYGTSGDGFKIVGVFSTSDNHRAAQLINEDSQSVGA